ncbi:MAG: recombinase family protein [Clostridia bacterium]|nr:recombinase family protein [Clostridia bacterium]
MKIAACYIRVSTDDQAEYSPQSQLKEIRKYAELHGYYIPDEYIFTDEGISGRSAAKRPQFQKLIVTAKKKPKPFDAVLLWKFSRFARNRTDAIVYKNLLRNECGIDVISISENLGEDRGTALILESMFEAMDEYYSINLSAEVKRSMKMLAENGAALGPAPFGYKNESKQYVIDEVTAPIIKMIFNLYENGTGVRTIARKLSDMGVKTKRGNPPDNRFVEYILRNPFYKGQIRWSDNRANNKNRYKNNSEGTAVYEGKHERIITEEQFDHVQEIIKEKNRMYQKYQRKESARVFMLKGLVRCNTCGSTLTMASTATPSLQCHSYNRGACNTSHSISLKKLNDIIISELKNCTENLSFEITPIEPKDTNTSDAAFKMIEFEKKKLLKIKEAYEQGVDSLEEYKENKLRITQRIKELESDIKPAVIPISKKDYAKKIEEVVRIIENPTSSEQARNEALRTIISKIVFVKPGNEIHIHFYF